MMLCLSKSFKLTIIRHVKLSKKSSLQDLFYSNPFNNTKQTTDYGVNISGQSQLFNRSNSVSDMRVKANSSLYNSCQFSSCSPFEHKSARIETDKITSINPNERGMKKQTCQASLPKSEKREETGNDAPEPFSIFKQVSKLESKSMISSSATSKSIVREKICNNSNSIYKIFSSTNGAKSDPVPDKIYNKAYDSLKEVEVIKQHNKKSFNYVFDSKTGFYKY